MGSSESQIEQEQSILFVELASGERSAGQPHQRLKDAYRHDPMGHIDVNIWEKAAEERTCWIQQMHLLVIGLQSGEEKMRHGKNRRRRNQELQLNCKHDAPGTAASISLSHLFNHSRRYKPELSIVRFQLSCET